MKDGEMVVNAQGGGQSFLSADFYCIPSKALRLLAQCLGYGRRRYGFENWKKIPLEDNLSHAMNHINEWRCGDRSEPHLVNAIARLFFALTLVIESGEQPEQYIHPDQAKLDEPVKLAPASGVQSPSIDIFGGLFVAKGA